VEDSVQVEENVGKNLGASGANICEREKEKAAHGSQSQDSKSCVLRSMLYLFRHQNYY
jgi:hypothetical protein